MSVADPDVQELSNYIYQNVYANYTAKMWGISIDKIDKTIIDRVQITLSENQSYFPNDKYQGLPVKGYTDTINKILQHPNIKLITNCAQTTVLKVTNHQTFINDQLTTDTIFYSGSIDELMNYQFGHLTFRSLNFIFKNFPTSRRQTTAVINYPTDKQKTRSCEYKIMTQQNVDGVTTIGEEFPGAYDADSRIFGKPYYPINNPENVALYDTYAKELAHCPNVHMIGRMGLYKYLDMDDAIAAVFQLYQALHQPI
ncbi:putative UDP-galactopyranose mutase [Bacteroidales bacterium Barb6]|nr:putative UDP-galactopyranose mutase [Bacteroidales bacterium Barb6]